MSINLSLLFAGLNWPERPWILLITVPALIFGIIPFLRLNKKRRVSSRHLIPFIIHMALILILSAVVAGISYTETYSESQGNIVMFLVDMSDSNAPTKDEMNDYMHQVMDAAKRADEKEGKGDDTKTKFGLIVFGGIDNNGIIKNAEGDDVILPGKLNPATEDFLIEYVNTDEENPRSESNIKLAIEKVKSTLSGDTYKRYSKRAILLSDGRETSGNSYEAASILGSNNISLDCAYFDFVNNPGDKKYKEVQVISLETNGTVKLGQEVEAQVVVNSTYHITDATITLKDVSGATLVSQSDIVIPKGQSAHLLKFTPRRYAIDEDNFANNELRGQEAVSKTGVQAISVEVKTDDDLLVLNNSYHSWYTFETQGEILIVYGNGSQLDQLKSSGILLMDQDAEGNTTSKGIIKNVSGVTYSVDTVATQYFPDTLEKMLKYDEIILMNVDFNKLGQNQNATVSVNQIASNIKRYVEEVGRGLLFTAGDNIYNYSDSYYCKDCDESYKLTELVNKLNCPVCGGLPSNEGSFVESPINEILPVEMKVDEEKETVAMVIVVDLSSSMKELVSNSGVICKTCNTSYEKTPSDSYCSVCEKKTSYSSPTRYHVVLDSVKKVVTESEFAPEDYIGVVVFDQDYHVALEIQPIGDEENRKTICEEMEYEFEHYYYSHYIIKETGEESDIRINFTNDGAPGNNKYIDKMNGKDPLYELPPSYNDGGNDKATGDCIKSRGTSYKWPVQEASAMLARASNITSIEIKQVVFMSDGAPNDKGSGYEGIVERMAKGGTVTSAIAIGINKSEAGAIGELDKIAVAGKGKLFLVNSAKDLEEDLTEITESIQGKLLNEYITVQPMRDSLNSIVHEGVQEYDIIHGYYGTTIKDKAERVIYVDNLRPLYSEWEYGLGKVCALMTDLGNEDWTSTMFDDTDEIANVRLIQNIVLSPIQKSIDSTGLDYTVTRDDTKIDITVNTYSDLALRNQMIEIDGETYELEEVIRASVYKFDSEKKIWVVNGTYYATPLANARYRVTVPTGSIDETYVIVLDLYKAEIGYTKTGQKVYTEIDLAVHGDDALRDTTALAVVGKTLAEYDVLRGDSTIGKDLLSGLVTNGRSEGLLEGDKFDLEDAFRSEEGAEKEINEKHNIDIPLIALALVLFVLDIIFRNFVIKRKPKKKAELSDEEVLESMRGR